MAVRELTSTLPGMTTRDIARGISGKLFSAKEVLQATVTLAERSQHAIHPFGEMYFDQAFDYLARNPPSEAGPFYGVPIAIKSSIGFKGRPHYSGMHWLKKHDWTASMTEHSLKLLLELGFVVIGTTTMPELGLGVCTDSLLYGRTHNPWKLGHSAGGSSGGAGAAVAAGVIPAALATDTGGSVRIPASASGLVGLKPSVSRIPVADVDQAAYGSWATNFPIVREMSDCAMLLDTLGGPTPDPTPVRPGEYFIEHLRGRGEARNGRIRSRLRIGVWWEHRGLNGTAVHPECVNAVRAAADALSNLGHEVVEGAHPEGFDEMELGWSSADIIRCYAANQLDKWSLSVTGKLGDIGPYDVNPFVWVLAQGGRELLADPQRLANRLSFMGSFGERFRSWWQGEGSFDLLLTPTMPVLPPELGTVMPPYEMEREWELLLPYVRRMLEQIAYTAVANFTGQPALSVPWTLSSSRLPIGLQLLAEVGREDLLMRVGSQIEEISPWDRLTRPKHHVQSLH